MYFTRLVPRWCGNIFKNAISEHMLHINLVNNIWELSMKWKPQNSYDKNSTLVQVMAWWCKTASHYLSRCWPIPRSLNAVTRPQCNNTENNGTCNSTVIEKIVPNDLHAGRYIWCNVWVENLISLVFSYCMQYSVITDHLITTVDSVSRAFFCASFS